MDTTIEPRTEQQTGPEPEREEKQKKRVKRVKRGFEPRPGHVVQAFVFALDTGARAEQRLKSRCGAARAACNWALSHVLASWEQRKAETSYGIAEDDLTPWRPWSLPSLRKAFNAAKRTDPRFAHWWQDNSKEAYNTGLTHAAAAFDAYAKSKRGKRAGSRMGKPRRKSKHRSRPACRFTTRPGRKTGAGRAGGATPRKRKEAGDRRRGTQPRSW